MKKLAILMSAVALVAMGGYAWAVDGGSGGQAHNLASSKGTCAKCHVPHGGKGDKIWAQDLTNATAFSGVHTLCNSCHYTGNTFGAVSGNTNVFAAGQYQNHSMLTWANTAASGITIPTGFVLDTGDTDTIWTVTNPDGAHATMGFYCGTCHNVHKQPTAGALLVNGTGDYLRLAGTQTLAQFGTSGQRFGACTQCHTAIATTGVASGHGGNCMICHGPHTGGDVATTANARAAEKILTISIAGNTFTALPNVPAFTANGYGEQIAALCYACHKTGGAASTRPLSMTLEHHQMSSMATLGAAGHAPGTLATDNGSAEFTCTNCHNMHDGTQDLYLITHANGGGSYTVDGGSGFCTSRCHNNKAYTSLGTADNSAHRWTAASSRNANGGCFTCHFIHDGSDRGTTDVAGTRAMMRVPPVNYNKALKSADADTLDYEDLCYGCHSTATQVGAQGAGALINNAYFTHRFSGTMTAGVLANITSAGVTLPYAAATTTGGVDYGATENEMYCGTCHNVHVQNATDREGQMFRSINNTASPLELSGICVDCHTKNGMTGTSAHPTLYDSASYDTDMPSPITAGTIPAAFSQGGDGYIGGRTSFFANIGGTGNTTGQIGCETCHNFHGANTTYSGSTTDGTVDNKGKLLVQDNFSDTTGSNMCRNCHGTNY